jgi:hypothetical protein
LSEGAEGTGDAARHPGLPALRVARPRGHLPRLPKKGMCRRITN